MKVKILDKPKTMDKYTWYKKWEFGQQNSQKVKKQKMLKRYEILKLKNSKKFKIL